MAKKKSTRTAATDRPPTPAERRRAIKFLQEAGGAHVIVPTNGLVQVTPALTIARCKGVIELLANVYQPYSGKPMDVARADVLDMVSRALEHAATVIRDIGAQPDAFESEVAHGE